jgi:hypothetical protein
MSAISHIYLPYAAAAFCSTLFLVFELFLFCFSLLLVLVRVDVLAFRFDPGFSFVMHNREDDIGICANQFARADWLGFISGQNGCFVIAPVDHFLWRHAKVLNVFE